MDVKYELPILDICAVAIGLLAIIIAIVAVCVTIYISHQTNNITTTINNTDDNIAEILAVLKRFENRNKILAKGKNS